MNSNLTGNLYYLLELATFVAVLFWQGKKQKNSGVEEAASKLNKTQADTIEALVAQNQTLLQEKKDLTEEVSRLTTRVEYLEEVLNIRGNAKMVPQRSSTRP